jgi:hypothetical protein
VPVNNINDLMSIDGSRKTGKNKVVPMLKELRTCHEDVWGAEV